jgi:two-component system phosphate regulon response regulator PhoB
MTDGVKVLVVEDEDDIRNLVVLNLRRAGFEVLAAPDARTAIALALEHRPPVVLLDRMLPDRSGVDICRDLRAVPATAQTYVIMVTARGEESDRIEGFEVGADDYVTKPFSVKELVLRVQAAARRVATPTEAGVGPQVELGRVRIDPAARRAWVDDEEMDLTATEYKLLIYLGEHVGRLCERGDLLEHVWELPPTLNTRTVDTHVKRLRQKLGPAAHYVETVRGAGYRFRVHEA